MNFNIINPVGVPIPNPSKGQQFGAPRKGHKHEGIDILVKSGTPVLAAADGEITSSEYQDKKNCGGFVRIKHKQNGNTFYTKYCHLRDIKVPKGKMVKAGEVIGLSGGGPNDPHRGSSKGAHLHFEIEDIAGNPYNPSNYLNKYYNKPTSSEKSKDLGILSQIVTPEDFEKLIEPYKNFNIFKGIFSK
jgi:murein DD-endopeptidase MepM/ murein hydrolase activator NlpD